jgi:hypothetical protein
MKTLADGKYLQLRGKVWTYYRRYPTHLIPVIGRTFIKKSLRTSDFKKALRLRDIETVRVDALFTHLEKVAVPVNTVDMSESYYVLGNGRKLRVKVEEMSKEAEIPKSAVGAGA